MQKLAELCVRRPVLASVLTLALLVLGFVSYFRLGVDRFPKVDLPTVAITTTVDVRAVLDTKRDAMAAHASQIPETATVLHLPESTFAAVYGYEWYVRRGPAGVLDELIG